MCDHLLPQVCGHRLRLPCLELLLSLAILFLSSSSSRLTPLELLFSVAISWTPPVAGRFLDSSLLAAF